MKGNKVQHTGIVVTHVWFCWFCCCYCCTWWLPHFCLQNIKLFQGLYS